MNTENYQQAFAAEATRRARKLEVTAVTLGATGLGVVYNGVARVQEQLPGQDASFYQSFTEAYAQNDPSLGVGVLLIATAAGLLLRSSLLRSRAAAPGA